MDANFRNLQKTYLLRTSDSRSYRVPNIGMFLKMDSVHLSVLCSFVQLNAHHDKNGCEQHTGSTQGLLKK